MIYFCEKRGSVFCYRVMNYTTESSNVREKFKNLDKLVTDLKDEILYKLD